MKRPRLSEFLDPASWLAIAILACAILVVIGTVAHAAVAIAEWLS